MDLSTHFKHSYNNIFGYDHQEYTDFYDDKKTDFAPLVNMMTLAINNNEVYGNKSSRPVFNKSSFIQENYSALKLLIPFYHSS